MIRALLEYAQTRGLASRPGYRKKQIRWVLSFDATGAKYTGLVFSEKEFESAPDLSFSELRALGAKEGEAAHFLIAPLGTWLAWAKDEAAQTKEQKRRTTLVKMLQSAAEALPALKGLALALPTEETRITALSQIESMRPVPKSTDLATVMLGSDFPVEDYRWHAWWDSFRADLIQGSKSKGQMVSFASGDRIQPEITHPKLTKLSGVGLSQPFAPIVTFDKPAFESYGLKQGANAAMDAESAKAYVTALDDLLERSVIYSWKRPKPNEKKQLAKEFVKLGGARILYWYSGPAAARQLVEEDLDPCAKFFAGISPREAPPEEDGEDRVLIERRLHDSIERIKTGGTSVPVGDVQFHLIALSGAGGRVMTRDYLQSSVTDLAKAAERWFDDLALVAYSGARPRDPSLEQVLTSPLRPKGDQDYLKWVTPVGAWRQHLWRAALLGYKIPESAAAKALIAFSASVVSGDLTDSEKRGRPRSLARLRLALVKAYLIRNKEINMQEQLEPNQAVAYGAAYHCGRLLAVYDDLQREAHKPKDIGAGVIQRYYGGAMTNPTGVFAQLSRLSMTHLDKLDKPIYRKYREQLGEIHALIANYPGALRQEEQALFALGFWHQIAAINKRIADASAAKRAREASNDTLPEEE